MGRLEIQGLLAKRLGFAPEQVDEQASYVKLRPSGPKEKRPIRSRSLKRQQEDRELRKAGGDPQQARLESFFKAIEAEEAGDCHCWECNGFVPDKVIRHATAHIFPKGDFESVAAHPRNYLILGASCCHDKSHRVDAFRKMGIWREAVDRFFEFEGSMTPEDRKTGYYALFVTAAREDFPELFKTRPDLCPHSDTIL